MFNFFNRKKRTDEITSNVVQADGQGQQQASSSVMPAQVNDVVGTPVDPAATPMDPADQAQDQANTQSVQMGDSVAAPTSASKDEVPGVIEEHVVEKPGVEGMVADANAEGTEDVTPAPTAESIVGDVPAPMQSGQSDPSGQSSQPSQSVQPVDTTVDVPEATESVEGMAPVTPVISLTPEPTDSKSTTPPVSTEPVGADENEQLGKGNALPNDVQSDAPVVAAAVNTGDLKNFADKQMTDRPDEANAVTKGANPTAGGSEAAADSKVAVDPLEKLMGIVNKNKPVAEQKALEELFVVVKSKIANDFLRELAKGLQEEGSPPEDIVQIILNYDQLAEEGEVDNAYFIRNT